MLNHKQTPVNEEKKAPEARTGGAAGSKSVKMNSIMQGMVKSMNHAATVPHFYLKDEFDVTKLVGRSNPGRVEREDKCRQDWKGQNRSFRLPC